MAKRKAQCVLAVGDAFNGLQLVGPFDDANEAGDYAEDHHKDETWVIVHVDLPKKEKPHG